MFLRADWAQLGGSSLGSLLRFDEVAGGTGVPGGLVLEGYPGCLLTFHD